MRIDIPWPPKELNPNARVHWFKKSKAAKSYKALAFAFTKQSGVVVDTNSDSKIPMQVMFYPPDKRIRDDDNLVAAFKSARDGIALALEVDDNRFLLQVSIGEQIRGGVVRVFFGDK